MSIHIDEKNCIGCGKCVDICPGNLIILRNKKAAIRDVRDCWGCTACVKICPKNAVCYQLAADLGGADSKMFAHDTPKKLTWIFQRTNGEESQIIIDKTQSNKY